MKTGTEDTLKRQVPELVIRGSQGRVPALDDVTENVMLAVPTAGVRMFILVTASHSGCMYRELQH